MEDNQLIENFWISQGGKPHMEADIPFYESDWHMLMQVVEKMRLSIEKTYLNKAFSPEASDLLEDMTNNLVWTNIKGAHKTIVEFIKWHNTQSPLHENK